MGYSRGEIEESLSQAKYDDIFATYLLLGRKSNDVSICIIILQLSSLILLIIIIIIPISYSPKVMVLDLVVHYH